MEAEQNESVEIDVVGIAGDLEWIDSKPRENVTAVQNID